MDFDFRTFSTRSFERFAQALSTEILGPGVMVFGDGPDGGREAAFDGKLDFPTLNDPWDGHTVMQAKFLQVPKAPVDDANWLASQLEAELQKFTASGSKLHKPDYYILVSNARLSPMPASKKKSGGIAKVDAIFEKYRKKLGLVDYQIWHLDQINAFLMNADGLRKSYAAWLSTSDVISELLAELGKRKRETSDAMYRYLSRELRTHQPVRLQQAGHSGDVATMIEDVFTDLPFSEVTDSRERSEVLLLQALLGRSRDRLDQASVLAQTRERDGRPERILLLGGPGQGKSTVSQFIGQIFRANILKSDRKGVITTEIERIVSKTLTVANEVADGTALPRRLPFRVDLPSFADKQSRTGDDTRPSLLRHLSEEISLIADSEVGVEDLRAWLVEYPSIIILDGLDEVPPSANRTTVIQAINEFWDEVLKGDLLMIVTTRPQGYNDDLDPKLYTKYTLTPLSAAQATEYGIKLAKNRLIDLNQRDRVISRLREAARSPTTSRLMVSPLQVAILLALIDQRGEAPSDRWSLFDKYFAVVLEREQGKVGRVGETMRVWGRQITALHHKAGFLLHVEAGKKGNADAFLSTSELHDLIRGQLLEEEFEGEELENTANELLAASTERLVLLVQRAEARFSFEVRSLQEFMAAAYLMTGMQNIVQERFEEVANRNHWLHVFQIAASKCFAIADSQHLRDTIVTICRALNDAGDELDRFLKTGSYLALSLLDDGVAYDQPKYRRLLHALSMEVLENGPLHLPDSLTDHCIKEPARSGDLIKTFLASNFSASREAALLMLMRLTAAGEEWAERMLREEVPTEAPEAATFLALMQGTKPSDLLNPIIRSVLDTAGPSEIMRELTKRRDFRKNYDWLKVFPRIHFFTTLEPNIQQSLTIEEPTPLSFRAYSIEISPTLEEIYEDIPKTESWEPVHAIISFHREPTATMLASLLRIIEANKWETNFSTLKGKVPWPLMTAIWVAEDHAGYEGTARLVEEGSFGDKADWVAAETRWAKQGFQKADLEQWATGSYFDKNVATIGAPPCLLSLRHTGEPVPWLGSLLEICARAQGNPRSHLIHIARFIMSVYQPSNELDIEQAKLLLEFRDPFRKNDFFELEILRSFSDRCLSDPEVLERLCKFACEGRAFNDSTWPENSAAKITNILLNHIEKHPCLISIVLTIIIDTEEILHSESDIENIIDSKLIEKLLDDEIKAVALFASIANLITGDLTFEKVALVLDNSPLETFSDLNLATYLRSTPHNTKRNLQLGELIARHLNLSTNPKRTNLFPFLNQIADQRQSLISEKSCWDSLELGDKLFALSGRNDLKK